MFHRQTRTTHINNIGTQLIIPLHCGTKKCRIIARLCTERTSTLCHFGWAAPRSNREIQQYKKTQYKGIHLEDDKRRKSRYMTNGHDWVSRNRQEQNRLFDCRQGKSRFPRGVVIRYDGRRETTEKTKQRQQAHIQSVSRHQRGLIDRPTRLR